MNLQHLRTFIWLRYRLRVNQVKRGGTVNAIVLTAVAVAVVTASVGLSIAGFLVGLLALPEATPIVRLLVWDGIVAAFLFSWMIGLMTELQRTDALSLDKFLHLPVSPVGAFLINYLSSLFNLSTLLFVPGMIGLLLGQTFAEGPLMLLAFPLLIGFLFAVTAITYQFQGWLATLMTNPRRRRTVIAVVMLSFVVVFQLPNLLNVLRSWHDSKSVPGPRYVARLHELEKSFKSDKITLEEYQQLKDEANRDYRNEIVQSTKTDWNNVEKTTRSINFILPPAWLPLGAADLAGGAVLPAFLSALGYSLIGSFGLWRAYRTTLRIYTGYNAGGLGKAITSRVEIPSGPVKLRLIEWRLPGIPECAAAVAAAGLRSLLRAPEAKMALIVPLIVVLVFGSFLFTLPTTIPVMARPLFAFGVTAIMLVSAIQLIGNQFGYDRGGFRIFVLSPVPRHDVLLGKNLATAPLTLGLIPLVLIALEVACPMRVDHFLASFLQAIGMYMLFCLLANAASIIAPQPIASGAMKPSQTEITPILIQFAVLFAFPFVVSPYLLPLGFEVLLVEVSEIDPLPIALPLTLGIFIGTVFLYRRGVVLLGRLLSNREQKILEVVTSRSE